MRMGIVSPFTLKRMFHESEKLMKIYFINLLKCPESYLSSVLMLFPHDNVNAAQSSSY